MWPPDFEPCQDLSAAEWIRPRLTPWGVGLGTSVPSIVPGGYDAYVRVFHPARTGPYDDPVSWQEVADWSGGTFHPLAQFEAMSTPVRPNPGQPPFDQVPHVGDLALGVRETLVRELARLTYRPSECFFAIWEGDGILTGGWVMLREFGADDNDDGFDALEDQLAVWQDQVGRLPRFEHPDRRYLLGRGPIDVASDLDRQPLGHDPWPTLGLTPQLWWPEDRAWVVATEIDFDSTIVATTSAGAEALLACEGIEALLVPSDGRLDLGGDEINTPL